MKILAQPFKYYLVLLSKTMETVCVKLEDGFAKDMRKVMQEHRYTTTAEFIRESVRKNMKDLEKEAALMRLQKAYGAGKAKGRRITDEDIHKAGEEAFREVAKKLGIDVD